MEQLMKNIPQSTVLSLSDAVSYLPGQVVSKTLSQNKHVSLTLFAFSAGEEISTHESEGDAMVLALDGTGKITLDGKEHFLSAGECIIMPRQVPHAVYGETDFKMLLIVVFPQ
ncbi:cupin domain-containing protein [Eubacteriales bacterium OttesenSCG-928-M02]|nr:cupin domain-containing protein [Eubacteriales bacterium OttesenSCG-928-M02]